MRRRQQVTSQQTARIQRREERDTEGKRDESKRAE